MMIVPGVKVYPGMIVGEHSKGKRSGRQCSGRQEADQHSRLGQGYYLFDPAVADDAGKGDCLYRQ